MYIPIDLIGKKFTSLVVEKILIYDPAQTKTLTLCKCKCGNYRKVIAYELISNRITSCGCKCHLKINLIGHIFTKLTVIKKSDYKAKHNRNSHWLCLCECGNTKVIIGTSLTSGNTTSCGCISRGSQTHGTIYGIYDKDDNLKYIGQTIAYNLEKRLNNHENSAGNQRDLSVGSLHF